MRKAILTLALILALPVAVSAQICHRVWWDSESICVHPQVRKWCVSERGERKRFECAQRWTRKYDEERADFIADNPDLPGAQVWGVALERAGPEGLRKTRRCANKLARWVRKGDGKPQPRC